MSEHRSATLFYPFAAGLIAVPERDAHVLYLGAQADFSLPEDFFADIRAVQGFRPDYLALERRGLAVSPVSGGENYDLALVLLGRHRGQNESRLGEAVSRTRAGGRIVVAGGKTDGVTSLRKRAGRVLQIEDSAAKYHGVVFWLRNPQEIPEEAIAEFSQNQSGDLVEGRFHTAPGMFSHAAVDPGSRFLADNLPDEISGRVADFGAGWGFLSAMLGERHGVSGLDLYEADYESLEAARKNLAETQAGVETNFFWRDLFSEPVDAQYDVIVMNPPFHHGRAAEPHIGQRMIAATHAALKRGGTLYLVANRPLPYEETLGAAFARHGEFARDARFKLLWAQKK